MDWSFVCTLAVYAVANALSGDLRFQPMVLPLF
jgi:hypothetical protein